MISPSSWVKQHDKMDIPLKGALLQTLQTQNQSTDALFPVIIQLKPKLNQTHIHTCQKLSQTSAFSFGNPLPLINSFAAKTSLATLKKLCATSMVQHVYLNRTIKVQLNIAAPSVGTKGLHKSGLTGKGVTIAVLDTGIYPHPDIKSRLIGFKDFVNKRITPYDDNGHGTHVAGCAAGSGLSSKGLYTGSAPGANLVGVKVFNKDGTGAIDRVIQGIQWCITNRHRYKIRVINLSLGTRAFASSKKDPLCAAAEKAVKAGLVVVVAAGNSGPLLQSIESPGISPYVITVGAVDDKRTVSQLDDTLAIFSSRGPTAHDKYSKPDILAPGVNIISLRTPNSSLEKTAPKKVGTHYMGLSGTSFATPIVAGAAAQILQKKPTLTPLQVKAAIKKYAYSLGLTPNLQGKGILSIKAPTPMKKKGK